jgi:hypothetical protein
MKYINPQKYRNKTERIYRVLLNRPYKHRTPYKIAKLTKISPSWVYYILDVLESKGILRNGKIVQPKTLLINWANRRDRRSYRDYHIRDPVQVLLKKPFEYALTTYYAENQISNYLFPQYYEIYIRFKDINNWHRYLSKRGLVGGGNFRIILADEFVFWKRRVVNDFPIVSVQQLIVDLLREGPECIEAAELLMEKYYGRNRNYKI